MQKGRVSTPPVHASTIVNAAAGPMMNFSWLPPVFAEASERLAGTVSEFSGGATVSLAVTGLSRSGKTVFVTSLTHNLLSLLHNPNRMPLLSVVAEGRL